MADQKLTQLAELTTPASDDILYIVDDVTGTATSKKITYANLIGSSADALQLSAAYSDEGVTDLVSSTSDPVWTKYVGYSFSLTGWKFDVITAPTGSAITLDVHKNGTTIFSTKPTIAAAANTSTDGTLTTSPTAFAVGDKIEVFVDAVGSTVTGNGLKGDPIGTLT